MLPSNRYETFFAYRTTVSREAVYLKKTPLSIVDALGAADAIICLMTPLSRDVVLLTRARE
jgi:hypothetical protein